MNENGFKTDNTDNTENTKARSQFYIGTPAGVVFCVDGAGEYSGTGFADVDAYLWHGYRDDAVRVTVPEQLLAGMEDLFDLINYPRATTTRRSFDTESSSGGGAGASRGMPGNPSNVPRCLTDDELLQKSGRLATFIIRVQQRQNSSWQGRITWVEKDRTLRFRSMMELVRLIESGISTAVDAKQN